jgi:hypothetical protein
MRLATGFCAAFLSASEFAAAAGVSCVATCVPSGATGVSCATSGITKASNDANIPRQHNSLFGHCIMIDPSRSFFAQLGNLAEIYRRYIAKSTVSNYRSVEDELDPI